MPASHADTRCWLPFLPAAEFYQTLLREFLEGSADAGGANWHSVRGRGGATLMELCCVAGCHAKWSCVVNG